MKIQKISNGRKIISKLKMTDCITPKELKKLYKNLEWKMQKQKAIDNINDDGESIFLENFYSSIQTFGATDYKDHRNDTLEELKKLIWKCITETHYQRVNFYNNDGSLVKKIFVKGYLGGYTAYFSYKDYKYKIN